MYRRSITKAKTGFFYIFPLSWILNDLLNFAVVKSRTFQPLKILFVPLIALKGLTRGDKHIFATFLSLVTDDCW